MKVSIIIPVIEINNYIKESISHIINLDYSNFEVLILPDRITDENRRYFGSYEKVKLIPTTKSAPAFKRDLGTQESTGDILAFLDDDAYPRKDWLKNATKYFENEKIAAVCGPAVTPDSDQLLAKASGAVYTSWLGGGGLTYRYWPKNKVMEIDDYPSVNFIVRKDIFQKIGGFNSHYWPGEDTKLCLEIVNLGQKIIYDPEIFVWHHRRPSIKKHLKQIWNYSVHRGHFTKKFPQTSFRPGYFIPTFFVVFIALGAVISIFSQLFLIFYFFVLLIYILLLLMAGFLENLRVKSIGVGLLVIPLIFFTHLTYGVGFVVGLTKKELKQ